MKTKQAKLSNLIEKLGMQVEMKPLLDSDSEIYTKFEKVVEGVLERYNGKRPRIKKMVTRYTRPGEEAFSVLSPGVVKLDLGLRQWQEYRNYVSVKLITYERFDNFKRCADYFKRNYGIGCEPETLEQIGLSEKISGANVGQHSRRVIEFLKQNHKKDLWYGSL